MCPEENLRKNIGSVASSLLKVFPHGYTTRFAPSPTGLLHLGHIFSMIIIDEVSKESGGKVLLRIEDHDEIRSNEKYTKMILEDLHALGFTFNNTSSNGHTLVLGREFYQSSLKDAYALHINSLRDKEMVYQCSCSRKKIASRNAHTNRSISYDNYCRPHSLATPFEPKGLSDKSCSTRFVSESVIWVQDCIDPFSSTKSDTFGEQIFVNPLQEFGDFVVIDKDGQFSYHFAVVCDDIQQNIDVVIRGMDIKTSTAKQVELFCALSQNPPPLYFHHPLLTDSSGEKLSKSTNAPSVRSLIEQGLSSEQIKNLAIEHARM